MNADKCKPFPLENLPYIIARPNQPLSAHLQNMCHQIPESIVRLDPKITILSLEENQEKRFSLSPSFFSTYLKLVYALHDFGKISPYFQQKLFAKHSNLNIPKLPKACIPFSYHAQVGSLLAWVAINILFEEFTEVANDTICLKDSFNKSPKSDNDFHFPLDDLLWSYFDQIEKFDTHIDTDTEIYDDLTYLKQFFATAGSLSILMHHNRGLDNSTENIMRKNVRQLRPLEALAGVIEGIREYLFVDRKHHLNILSSIFDPIIPEKYGWKHILSIAIIRVILLPLNKDDIETLADHFDDTISDFLEYWGKHESETNFSYSLFFELVYSLLCETDEWDAKYYKLHRFDPQYRFERARISLPYDLVVKYRQVRFPTPVSTNTSRFNEEISHKAIVNHIRNELFHQVKQAIDRLDEKTLRSHLFIVDAPTGAGKTLSLLHFGLNARNILREKYGHEPRIIYCLPFISIIDQVGAVIQDVLQTGGILVQDDFSFEKDNSPSRIKQSILICLNHHLADSKLMKLESADDETLLYDEDSDTSLYSIKDNLYEENSYHLINTWQPEIIVTSFVKFFNTICKAHKRELIRFHRLAGSIILIDEIQAIPAKYWRLIKEVLENLIEVLGCTIVLSSATSPVALTNLERLQPYNLFIPPKIISLLHRYDVHLQFLSPAHKLTKEKRDLGYDVAFTRIDDFLISLKTMIKTRPRDNILIVLNTTRSAYQVYSELAKFSKECPCLKSNNLYLLSTQILPVHREKILNELTAKLKEKQERIILVSTQVVEAGVDVSFDVVIRDFAPLDSIIQVAGRCNRNFERSTPGEVHVYYLVDMHGRRYAAMTYREHTIDLLETQKILLSAKKQVISENELAKLTKRYFTTLESSKKTMDLFFEFKGAKFSNLFNNFALIEEQDFSITLVFHLEENSALIKDLYYKRKIKYIPNRLRKYTLETSKANFKWITERIHETHYKTIKLPSDPDPAFYIIHLHQIPNAHEIYTERSGLVLNISV